MYNSIVNFLKLKNYRYKIPGISYFVIDIIHTYMYIQVHTLSLILYVKLIYAKTIRVYDIIITNNLTHTIYKDYFSNILAINM